VVTKASWDDAPVKADTATTVTLHLNSRIEHNFSKVLLDDTAKQERPLEVMAGEQGDTLTIQLPALAAGAYGLRYKVLAVDGHVTEQMLRFEVKAPD
jgi:methionine-rich copper-binding protein CopC